jgi:hypothetical protein
MADEPPGIPLADVLRAANELVSAGLIEDYALGGALAAIYYVEPFTTYDADIIFVTKDKTLSPEFLRSIRICNRKVGAWNANICWSTIFPSSFWPRPD